MKPNYPAGPTRRGCSTLLVLVLMFVVRWSVSAERLSLNTGFTQPFYAPNLKVEWAVPTNALPRTATVYTAVSDAHPEVTLSNLMRIGRFKPADRINGLDPQRPFLKRVYGFRAANDGRTLVYDPEQGSIDYDDETAFHGPTSPQKVKGVPDDATALELAFKLLPMLGISTNDLVRNESGEPRCVFPTGSWGRTGKDIQVYRRGVGFTRSLDGKEMDDQRAAFIEFGNQAKVGKIEVHWRAMRPKGSYPVAQPSQILHWIKEGRALVLSLSGPNDARYVHVADIQKLTIVGAQVRYRYRYDDEDGTPSSAVFPYALLTARAEFGTNDSEQVFLYSPVIAEGLPEAQRPEHGAFSIYPSGRSRREQDVRRR